MLSPLLTFSLDSKGKHDVESIGFYKIVFHHLDMTQLNFNNVKKIYDEILF